MKKTLWTVNVDNYAPEVTALTYPLLRRYADKCGAEFRIISERKFPAWPPVYEKLQIHELGRDSDWNIYIDSDVVVQPDMFDITNHLPMDTVCHQNKDMAGNRWKYDEYFKRDGRNIGSCNWFTIGSNWCLDLWKPLEAPVGTPEEAVANIRTTVHERATHVFNCQNPNCHYSIPTEADSEGDACTRCGGPRIKSPKAVITAHHLIDDYAVSRNIARYGLKFTTLREMQEKMNDRAFYLWHMYTFTTEQKVEEIKKILVGWGLTKFI